MADSIRQQIRSKVITLLGNIKTANGYNFTVRKISRQLKGFDDLSPSVLPALFVLNADEKKEDYDVDDLHSQLQVLIIGYVHSALDPTDELDKLIADIEKAICVNRFLGDDSFRVINTIPSDIKTDKGTLLPFGVVEFTFIIKYVQAYGTP
jgi:hypothetical protein